MKKAFICIIFIVLALCNGAYAQDVNYNLNLSTEAVILIDANDGTVIYEKYPIPLLQGKQ